VYRDFVLDFDVCRKLLKARATLEDLLQERFDDDSLEEIGEQIEYWEWTPG
jgi:hypothetical protein